MKTELMSGSILFMVMATLVSFFVFVQFLTPTLSEPDEYYHIASARFIKDLGPGYNFHWAKFSVFNRFFSDKEFLFHLFSVPFLFFSGNIVTSGKLAVIFYNILFIFAFYFILKKYLPKFLIGFFLLLPFLNAVFLIYFLRLRPATLANIVTILGIYFLINRRWISVFFLSFIYSLAHISFLTIVFFAFICEFIRFIMKQGFFQKNIFAVICGVLLGCILHPNNPNNWLSFHLNAILVPLYTITGVDMGFGAEFLPASTKFAFIYNFVTFFVVYFILLMVFIKRIELSFSTYAWWACGSFYLVLSLFGARYWYLADTLVIIFFASFVKDWIRQRQIDSILPNIRKTIIAFTVIIILFFPLNIKLIGSTIEARTIANSHYENIARWMSRNIPEGETVYHARWSDSSYFICLNPKNDYLVVLDPIYMFYSYPKIFMAYQDLLLGKAKNPYQILRTMFKLNYGYAGSDTGVFLQVKEDKKYFAVLYEDNLGIIFKIL